MQASRTERGAFLSPAFENPEPTQIIDWALKTYAQRLALACSFGGPGGMVLLDMFAANGAFSPDKPLATLYYLQTDLLFPETHDLIARVKERYGIEPVAIKPELTLGEQAQHHGDELWKRDPDRCCDIRKVEPQRAFLSRFDAWVTGLRRSQSATRSGTPYVQWDDRFDLVKINPLASWDDQQIWSYVVSNMVPYNVLNDRGYPSVGCYPCTRRIEAGEDARAGRWDGFSKTECGLHG